MKIEDAFDLISLVLGSDIEDVLRDGLPDGKDYEDCGYDKRLVYDIASAVKAWQNRLSPLVDPYVVSYFNGRIWTTVTEEMRQEEAYREWFELTKKGTEQCNPACKTYFYLHRTDEELNGRHEVEEEEEDFSVKYLLGKSFGE